MPVVAKKTSPAKSVKTAKAVAKPMPTAKVPAITVPSGAWPQPQPLVKPTSAAKPKAAAKRKPAAKAPAPKPVKPAKVKKPKLVRDSFTMPKIEYAVFDQLKARANQLASPAKKSELLRAGVKALAALSDAAFLAALKAVPAIKTGRPAKA